MKSMSRILETEGSVAWPPARFCVTNKSWGRPRATGIGPSNRDEMAETELAMIGEWRRKQLDLPSRTAALRQLVTAMLHLLAKDPDEKPRRSEAVGCCMPSHTLHVVQAFEERKGSIIPVQPKVCPSAGSARALAARLAQNHAGVIVWSRTGNPDLGDWGPSEVLVRTGVIPDEYEAGGGVE